MLFLPFLFPIFLVGLLHPDIVHLKWNCCKENGYVKICRNVFVVIIPLVSDKKVCEIEDLFLEETLKTSIDGRTFEKKVKKGDKDHYSKDVFSKYVYRSYKNINFNNFDKLLNILQTIINEYGKCSEPH